MGVLAWMEPLASVATAQNRIRVSTLYSGCNRTERWKWTGFVSCSALQSRCLVKVHLPRTVWPTPSRSRENARVTSSFCAKDFAPVASGLWIASRRRWLNCRPRAGKRLDQRNKWTPGRSAPICLLLLGQSGRYKRQGGMASSAHPDLSRIVKRAAL